MMSPADEDFLKTAVAAVPRIADIIASFPAIERQAAFDFAEKRYVRAAQNFGCTDPADKNLDQTNHA